MLLKDLIEQYGEYEVNSKCVVGECEIERIVIDLTKLKPKTVWDLKKGDWYYCINVKGETMSDVWREVVYPERDVGNAFLTKEEAEREVERRKVETLLLKYGGRRWFKKDRANWGFYDDLDSHLIVTCFGYVLQGAIYFDTQELAEKAISEIGEERIKSALFEVR